MTSAIRLFYAISLGAEAREALSDACAALRSEVPFASWTHPADYHVTVKFIGDVDPSLAERLAGPVREAVADAAPFGLALGGFDTFGRRGGAPDILWCGVTGAVDALRALHARVDAAAAQCGVARDTRPFRAHITAARRYRGDAFAAHAGRLAAAAPAPSPWRADELILYRTRFGQKPAYEALQRYPLGGSGGAE
ncbi:RNA 2',3'-cyclic phosphodiesterase [Paenibacillus sp.]|uniref:RNA 2',3'-cyclic phosphodiesterase n=1 Tax=Paenibacillus sp. TaxID=58172 RepID=UPI002D39A1CC|nr:RNA 2',3'-cyclic phosphodiesterase [Paenibacillus sp.]HZG87145.1 RNA 2',3'-cyclic phosphodiesterase [Paenibacillus sp.]